MKGNNLISTLFIRRTGDDPQAKILLNRLQAEGNNQLKNLTIEKVVRLEGIDEKQAKKLDRLFCHPISETLTSHSTLHESEGPIFEVGYQRAVTDPELPSVLRSSHAMGIKELEWVRIAYRYQFQGLDSDQARKLVEHYLFNPQVQILIQKNDLWETLKPQGKTGPVEIISLQGLTYYQLKKLSEDRRLFLNLDQMKTLQQISQSMKRAFTDAELEMFAQTWSDHCYHTTWKSLGLLEKLIQTTQEINHPMILSVFEDNAGAIKFYEEWALTIKGETHNSPTAISPYGGIMTKHGGVIRDTLGCGQGSSPIGGTTIMGLADPRIDWKELPLGVLHPKTILLDAIRGTADYTNPMGIPMMFPIYRFHPGYIGKCFALGHSIGLIPEKRAKKGIPIPGDLLVLIGGKTGRDGLHGATVSSGAMTSETAVVDAAHVQIGHPIEERKFMEAIPILRDQDCLHAITDLGAAGLSSAVGEMGSDTGVWVNLACVPLKTEGLLPWEIWISESQERMLLCVPPLKIKETLNILSQYEVPHAIIGYFTNTNQCQVIYDPQRTIDPSKPEQTSLLSGEIVINLDFKDLRKKCPLPQVATQKPVRKSQPVTLKPLKTEEDWISSILSILSHLNICDQSPAGYQFDNTIQGHVVIGPYGGFNKRMPEDIWAATPLPGKQYTAVASIGYNPLYGEVDPVGMTTLVMIDSITKLVAAGVNPKEIVLCDNFYTPEINAEVAWILREMVYGCCNLSKKLRIPFVSGKDSSSGTFIGKDGTRVDIPPTLAVMALGKMKNVNRLIRKPWKKSGNLLYLIGPLSTDMGGSIYFDTLNHRGNKLSSIPIESLQPFWKVLRSFQTKRWILSASAISQGGLIRNLFEMALGSHLGCSVDLSELSKHLKIKQPEIGLFAEMIGAILIEVQRDHSQDVTKELDGIYIGKIDDNDRINIHHNHIQISLSMETLIKSWEKPFQEVAK